MKGFFYILIGVSLATANLVFGQRDVVQDFRQREYPQYFTFRGEGVRGGYEQWLSALGEGSSGIIRKFMLEEIKVDPVTIKWVTKYLQANQSKIGLLHLNGEGRQVVDYPDVVRRYFPGHWVYEQGSSLGEQISPSDTIVKVANVSAFSGKGYINRHTTPVSWFAQHVIIVPVGVDGEKDWYNSEYAIVKSVDHKTRTLTLARGSIHSKARYFSQGAYIAPIAGDVWGDNVMWYYNISSACPKDRNAMTASDIFVNEISEWFGKSGELHSLHGVAFDVNYFDMAVKGAKWDVNNDGISDGGWCGGENLWRNGDWQFLKKLRSRLGSDAIISCDAHHPHNQQAVGILNGMESEGLVQHNDAWRGFSRTLNTHSYWKENNSQPDFRYVVMKFMNPYDFERIEAMSRFVVGTACCLEAYVTQNLTGYRLPSGHAFMPEDFRKERALGGVRGRLTHMARESQEWMSQHETDIMKRAKGVNCNVRIERGALVVEALPTTTDSVMKIHFDGITLPQGDMTFFVTAQAIDPLEGFAKTDLVPRIMWLEPSNLPEIKNRTERESNHSIYGMYGTRSACENSYYFRNALSGDKCGIDMTIQGRGRFRIERIELYNSPDIIARSFEHGLVVVNPAQSTHIVKIDGCTLSVPPLDAIFVKD